MNLTDEDLQQSYMMLLNSKQHLRKVKETWLLKKDEIDELCEKISKIQNRIYELIHYFDFEEKK